MRAFTLALAVAILVGTAAAWILKAASLHTQAASAAASPRVVDLEHLEAQMPNNLYFKLGVPTTDPEVLKAREAEERSWRELYGKVLSNKASEEEVRRYYAHRRRVSEDYVQVADRVLNESGPTLKEDERGLFELSRKMHKERLSELPRQESEAIARTRSRLR
jgi:hypothetical protein